LVDRIAARPVLDGDVRHGQSQLVHVLDAGGPASVIVRHSPSVGGSRWKRPAMLLCARFLNITDRGGRERTCRDPRVLPSYFRYALIFW
jgi:hypothetical protein